MGLFPFRVLQGFALPGSCMGLFLFRVLQGFALPGSCMGPFVFRVLRGFALPGSCMGLQGFQSLSRLCVARLSHEFARFFRVLHGSAIPDSCMSLRGFLARLLHKYMRFSESCMTLFHGMDMQDAQSPAGLCFVRSLHESVE